MYTERKRQGYPHNGILYCTENEPSTATRLELTLVKLSKKNVAKDYKMYDAINTKFKKIISKP